MIILVFTYASDRSNQSDQGALDLRDVCFEAIIGAKNLKKLWKHFFLKSKKRKQAIFLFWKQLFYSYLQLAAAGQ